MLKISAGRVSQIRTKEEEELIEHMLKDDGTMIRFLAKKNKRVARIIQIKEKKDDTV